MTTATHPATYYVEMSFANGGRYGVMAVEGDDGMWRPDVAYLYTTGEPTGHKLVDAETSDEAYSDPRTCLQMAVANVL
jgi:DNA gyrase inhibitor GyrI